jgi:hypothetical protein
MFDWLYEIGKEIGFIKSDMLNHLKGFDLHCEGYYGTPYATYLALAVLGITGLVLILQYYVIDHPPKRPMLTWWLIELVAAILNFFTAYMIVGPSIAPGHHCADLKLNGGDVIGVSFFNALCGLILAMFLFGLPWLRRLSTNNVFTTFYPNR